MYCSYEEALLGPFLNYDPEAIEEDVASLRYMVSEKCWDLVETSLPNCISPNSHLNPLLLRSMFYGIVHVSEDDISMRLRDVVQSHWNYHPPQKEGMHELYSSFFLDNLKDVIFSEDLTSYTFWKVYKELENMLKNEESLAENERSKIGFDKAQKSLEEIERLYKNNDFNYINEMSVLVSELTNSTEELMKILDKIKKSTIHDEPEMASNTRINRLLSVFTLYLDLLECDLIEWTKMIDENIEKNRIPLIVKLLEHCKSKLDINYYSKVPTLYVASKTERKDDIARFIALLTETTKLNTQNAKLSISFESESAERFSVTLADHINSSPKITSEGLALVKKLQPSWFRINVASHIISKDDLISSVQDIIQFIQSNLTSGERTTLEMKNSAPSSDTNVDKISKAKIRAANKRNCYGETKLHHLCRQKKTI